MGKPHINQAARMPGHNGQLALERSALTARAWLMTKALPFWAENAVDTSGGFCEELSTQSQPNWSAVRRLRVQARQVYTYSMANERGWFDDYSVADNTLKYMLAHGFMRDGHPGLISLINPNTSINDPRRDLYDHAFYLLALSWHARVSGQQTSLALADTVLRFLNAKLGASNGGFIEGLPESDPRNALRRQNPHMHMLEAYMALYDASGDGKYMRGADEMFGLFRRHFFDLETFTVTEFFHDNWDDAKGEKGQCVEPGHMAEWVWLLGQYQSRTGFDTRPWTARLYHRLCSYDSLLLADEMDKSGRVLRSTRRLWVQTEMVKAHLAQAEMGEADSYRLAAAGIDMIMEKYLRPDGTWVDVLGENGLPVLGAVPTSTFYHIMCMTTEACRVAGIADIEKPKVLPR